MSNEKLPGKNGFKHIVVTTQLYLNESENTEARENFLLTMNAMEWPERSHGGDMVGRGARPAARKTAAMPTILGAPESMRLRGDSELQGGPVESLGGTRGSGELRRLTAAVGLGFQAWCGRTPYIEYGGGDVLWGERASRKPLGVLIRSGDGSRRWPLRLSRRTRRWLLSRVRRQGAELAKAPPALGEFSGILKTGLKQ
jgi:hypothetical protein